MLRQQVQQQQLCHLLPPQVMVVQLLRFILPHLPLAVLQEHWLNLDLEQLLLQVFLEIRHTRLQ